MSDETSMEEPRRGSAAGEDRDELRFLKRELKKMARVQLHLRQKFEVLHEGSNRLYEALAQLSPVDYPEDLKSVIAIDGRRSDLRFQAFAV